MVGNLRQMTIDSYLTAQAARISGFSVRQLDYWARSGILIPSVQNANGQGTRRHYSFNDLVKLRFIQQLKEKGWSTQKIRKTLGHLRNFVDDSSCEPGISLVYDE